EVAGPVVQVDAAGAGVAADRLELVGDGQVGVAVAVEVGRHHAARADRFAAALGQGDRAGGREADRPGAGDAGEQDAELVDGAGAGVVVDDGQVGDAVLVEVGGGEALRALADEDRLGRLEGAVAVAQEQADRRLGGRVV